MPSDPSFATIYTDASWRTGGHGGWGAWIRHSTGRCFRSGPLLAQGSANSEYLAAYAGIHAALQLYDFKSVLVCTDCSGIEAWLMRRKKPPSAEGQVIYRAIAELTRGVRIHVKWVRGHQNDHDGPQAYINNQVDKFAKEWTSTQRRFKVKKLKGCAGVSQVYAGRFHHNIFRVHPSRWNPSIFPRIRT